MGPRHSPNGSGCGLSDDSVQPPSPLLPGACLELGLRAWPHAPWLAPRAGNGRPLRMLTVIDEPRVEARVPPRVLGNPRGKQADGLRRTGVPHGAILCPGSA